MALDPKLSSLVNGLSTSRQATTVTPVASANEYEQLKAQTERITQSLAQMKGLQAAKEQEIEKLLEEAEAATPEEFMHKAQEMEQQQTTLLEEWKQRLLTLEPKVMEVNRELHL